MRRPATARLVGKALEALLREAASPEAHGLPGAVEPFGDGAVRESISGQDHDTAPLRVALGSRGPA